MSRKGKDLELLIELLEKSKLPQDASIKSPDYIADKITGEKREVDISIRYQLGSFNLLIVIECRDRKSIQDATWIEQVITKTKDLNANKVIAVSASEFTKNAIKKALHNGIEPRSLKEINPELIETWWAVREIVTVAKFYEFVNVGIELEDESAPDGVLVNRTSADKFIINAADSKCFSINDIFERATDQITEWNNLLPNGPVLRKLFNGKIDQNDKMYIRYEGRDYNILNIDFLVDLSIRSNLVPIHRASAYNSATGKISEVAEYRNVLGDKTVHLIKDENSIKMSISQKPTE